MFRLFLGLMAFAACSQGPTPADSGEPLDAGVPDAGRTLNGVMSLFELTSADGGVRLLALASIGLHREAGGCDVGAPARDADGAWLRIAGYRLGAQPTVCTDEDGGYVCRVPSGAVADLDFPAGAEPLGPGPILFAVGGGADLGPVTVSVSPAGTLSATLDGAKLHLSCGPDCSADRLVVLGPGLSCELPVAAEVTLPFAPTSVSVVRARVMRADDAHGVALIGRVGRGVTLP